MQYSWPMATLHEENIGSSTIAIGRALSLADNRSIVQHVNQDVELQGLNISAITEIGQICTYTLLLISTFMSLLHECMRQPDYHFTWHN